jgi:hypothetical protein
MPQNAQRLIRLRVMALEPDCDHDENDEERQTPVGTTGVIGRLNHIDSGGERHYDVGWDNGAWTVYSESEVQTDLQLLED